ncbi:hypothetical protein [Kutzneria buriramensis]|uniref:Uncharacterized protein n=1 Tax=Kutzneria buriramensis TaxID=1045776 RepID=A0A3E0GWX7_9PSEU|nr:hypothetical protein [Kutzneria buriramensis]REH28625.1 hypothetical protein BCF44_12667 [Kutzneria buriramensis]
MPHRLSLVRRAANLRQSYTGETDSTLLPAIVEGIQTLSPGERATLAEVLDHGYETRLLGENPFPTLDRRFRDVLVPDATDAVQQQLEAGILFALGQIAPYCWPESEVVAPMPVCRMVRPVRAVGETILHLSAATLAPMLAVLAPHVVDGQVRGLAGLRATLHRRHIQLHLADGGPTRTVSLSNTSYRQWVAALAFTEEVIGHGQLPAGACGVTAAERGAIRAGRVPSPVALASALLRRLRVLGDTFWLTVRHDGPDGMRLDWAGGRSAAQVAAALAHPLAGLAGERFYVTHVADGSVTMIMTGDCGEPTAKVTLHQAPLTMAPPFTRVDMSAAWTEFRRVMTAPHPELADRVATTR